MMFSTADTGKASFFKGYALIVLLIGLIIRFVLAPLFTYPFDVEHWAVVMQNIESGNDLYSLAGYFYTPVWGYLLGAQDLFVNTFLSALTYGERFIDLAGIEALTFVYHTSTVTTVGYNFVMKLPLIIVDVLVGYLIYRMALSESGDERKAVTAFGCWFLCPLVIYMSSVQVQFDCFSALFALICILFLKKDRYFGAGVFFALGALLKFFPLFCILLFGVYALRSHSDMRIGARQLSLLAIGIFVTVFVIYLPQILSGTVMDSLSFMIERGSNSDLYSSLRIWVPALLLIYTVFAFAFKAKKMPETELKSNLYLLALTLLCVATLCSSGPQYCIVYLPLIFVYAVVNSRKDLLTCVVVFTSLAAVSAFSNNNVSLVATLVEYCGFWDASGFIGAMQLVDGLTVGVNVRQAISFVVETTQLLFNVILLVLLYRSVGLFDKCPWFNQVADRLGGILGAR